MKKILILFLIVVFLLLPLRAKADEEINWHNVGSINGGTVNSIAISQSFSTDKTVYAATPAAIFVSHNAGENWDKIPFSLAEGANVILVSKYYRKNDIFLGTKNGIYLSENGGKYWQIFNRGMEESYIIDIKEDEKGNLFALSFNGILMERKKDGELWKNILKLTGPTATTITVNGDYIYAGCEDGTIYKISPADKEKEIIAENLTESPISKILIYNNIIYASTFYDGIFIGNKDNFNHELKGTKINDFAIQNGKIYVATIDKGILVKNEKWETLSSLSDIAIRCMALSSNFSLDGTMFIGTIKKGIYTSFNSGKTFAKSSNGLTGTYITAVSFSSTYNNDGIVFIGTKDNGLYESADSGKTFSSIPLFSYYTITAICTADDFSHTQTLFVGTQGKGLFESKDSAKNFDRIKASPQYISCLLFEDNKLFIGTGDEGIFIMDPENNTFTQSNNGILPFDLNVKSIAGSGNTIFIGTNGGSVYKSLDTGKDWQRVGEKNIPSYSIVDISLSDAYHTDKTLVVGTAGSGIYISKDGGSHFINISDALLKYHMWVDGVQLSPQFSKDKTILAGSWDGVYLSNDAGNMWNNITGNKDNRYVYRVYFTPDFAYNKSGAIYVATESGGLYILNQKKKIVIKMTIGRKGLLVNGRFKDTDVPPIIKNDRTILPVRFVAESLGAKVGWDGKTRKVTITLNQKTIEMYIGKSTAYINGKPIQIDPNNPKVTPVIINSRTFVPVRFVAEAFGAQVEWDNYTRTVTIIYEG